MKSILRSLSFSLYALLVPTMAMAANEYPQRPVKIIVPQPAASGGDLLGRLMAEKITPQLGQPVVIENRPGANGILAASVVKGSEPDGYTLMLTGVSVLSFNPVLYRDLPYKSFEDFTYIAPVANTSFLLVASKKSGISTVDELVQKAKGQADTLTYASSGIGNSTHLAAEMIFKTLGVKLLHVPYKGSAQILNALMAGEVDFTVGIPNSSAPLIQQGRAVGVAAMSDDRLPLLPDLPTFKELGYDLPALPGWYALVGPANLDPSIVERVNSLVQNFLNDPEINDKLINMGLTPIPGTAEEIRLQAKADAELWGNFITSNKIQLN